MTIEIAGRTAFVTGSANGIGLGIARALAKAGAKLALVDIDADQLAEAKVELGQVTDVETFVLDVRDRAAFERIADGIETTLGPVSLLFNNAGVAGGAPAGRMTYELWDWGMGINLDGVINGVQTFMPRMIERGEGGHIVHTASGAGLVSGGTAGVLYQTAKYAVVGMAETLALELADYGIGVSVLCPGPVATDIIRRTRGSQPSIKQSMTETELKAARAESARQRGFLAAGVSPDSVGEWVLAAVRRNQLYIHTDDFVVPYLEARTRQILDAMPPAAVPA
jgi:NAD(P)-dependent dehydrogenase (short-subunit alcohol dehydrogenase family)